METSAARKYTANCISGKTLVILKNESIDIKNTKVGSLKAHIPNIHVNSPAIICPPL